MHKKLKISIPILLILMITIFSSFVLSKSISAKVPEADKVNLVLDDVNYTNILPKHFRKTIDLTVIKDNKDLNLTGLDKLNISGSQQFSAKNLPLLIDAIGTKLPVIVVDLRQESHGFINEYAVSWADSKNNANAGLTREQVLVDEANKLKSIKLNVPITFYNEPNLSVVPIKVQDEKQLVSSRGLSYNRVTVRDGGIPTEDMVDYFVESLKTQPENSWMHFHCKEGIGRTGTFMIMYDMMKNYKNASTEDIIKRQLALANYEEKTLQSFYNNERMSFLNKFYDYCKANGDKFNIKWSDWKKGAGNSSAAFYLQVNLVYRLVYSF